MIKLKNIILSITENDDYRGSHKAPDHTFGAPLYDLTKIYPDDIYSSNAARYYGDMGGDQRDIQTVHIMQYFRNKPDKLIKVYRAVPSVISNEDKIKEFEKQKEYILKRGKLPPTVSSKWNKSEYYDFISKEIDNLKSDPSSAKPDKIQINPGDWVTINKSYAVQHGKSALNGKYRILTKIVPAKHLFTDANSIHEFGYDPN